MPKTGPISTGARRKRPTQNEWFESRGLLIGFTTKSRVDSVGARCPKEWFKKHTDLEPYTKGFSRSSTRWRFEKICPKSDTFCNTANADSRLLQDRANAPKSASFFFLCRCPRGHASPKGYALWLRSSGGPSGEVSSGGLAGASQICFGGAGLPPKAAETVSNVHGREHTNNPRHGNNRSHCNSGLALLT